MSVLEGYQEALMVEKPDVPNRTDWNELPVEVVSDEPLAYPHEQPIEEQRRAFIVETMAVADVDGTVMVDNMEKVYKWLTDGTVSRFIPVGRKAKAVQLVE